MLKLILTSDVRDLWRAATQAREFAEYISVREGWEQSTVAAFHALLIVRPWATLDHRSAPWRVIRRQMAMLPQPIRLPS